MRIMVVGGAGYIGTSLVPRLIDRDYAVEVVDLLWFGCSLPEGVTVRRMEAMDLTQQHLEGFDQVIFLGGLSNDPMAEYSPSANFIHNAALPAYLAYIAKRAKVRRFVYASSCSVYGYTVDEMYDEQSLVSCSYPYGISKLQGEQAALQMVDDNFSVIALRKGTVCGYSPRMRFDLVVNTMFKSATLNHEVVVNNPAIWRPVLSVKDACTAYIRAVEAHEYISGIFNVISGNFTVGEIGDIVQHQLEALYNCRIKLTIRNIQDYRNYKVSSEKAANVLSFKPRDNIESIIKDIAAHSDEYGDFSNPLYYNIEVFKAMIERHRCE